MEFETMYLVEGVKLEEGEDGRKKRVGDVALELHRTVSYANTAANRMHFEQGYTMTNVYESRKMKFVGKDNGYYA